MIIKMEFDAKWVVRIMHCIDTILYSIVLNRAPGMVFTLERGLRQDDCILFKETIERGTAMLEQVLKEYEECSGQCINYGKSIVFFSSNTVEVVPVNISNRLGVKRSDSKSLPLYTWKSIWAAKGLLLLGLRWRVGNEHNIRIEEDVWVPNVDDLLIKKTVNWQNVTKVEDLIDNRNRIWISELISNTFSEKVAQKIMLIPLAHLSHEDFLSWRGEASREYTVRSGYKILLQRNENYRPNQKQVYYDCQFQHARRIANVAAHNLASEGLKMDKNTYLAPGYAGKGITEAEVDRGWR
ncbi:hypothetical protein J1N35_034140 [Gossypium stocksii]|uniref:Reverse transcriptase domain-containing protein n=1 Tax=Gossypium stocksii TaxID=47602 RepID=A0A9D3US01_9ROSI|nr:hypothetical protein J1N35_034140 [Gossypium stocksii]